MIPSQDLYIFLGPSLPRSEAAAILDGTFLPPIRRGNMNDFDAGAIVVIIDGVFDQHLAVSPKEIINAISRGVRVFGGGSMGALRAAEIPAITGIGKIFEWYRDGIIMRDDEVALLFDPDTERPITVPSVNVRFAVNRLCSMGTIDSETANCIIKASLEIPFKKRTYRSILKTAGLKVRTDSDDLIAMLKSHDLKAQDARTVLESVGRIIRIGRKQNTPAPHSKLSTLSTASIDKKNKAEDELLIWETGDRASLNSLIDFLIFTGRTDQISRSHHLNGVSVDGSVQQIFNSAAKRWGWVSSEEASVTLHDLNISLEGLSDEIVKLLQDRTAFQSDIKERSDGFLQQLQAQCFLNALTLKKEIMRLGSLRFFAQKYQGSINDAALDEAKQVICKLHRVVSFSDVTAIWDSLGLADKTKQSDFIEHLACARASVSHIRAPLNESNNRCELEQSEPATTFCSHNIKWEVNARHTLAPEDASQEAHRLAKIIGISRIGMIGELSGLSGAFVAQAARPGNAWSSSYGSGKSLSREGAIVGSVMEELEKWAQEKFTSTSGLKGSYLQLQGDVPVVDPSTFDLPYDTLYSEDLDLNWHPAVNILDNTVVYIPTHLVTISQGINDIMFSGRGARKIMATNGLGAGFSREEAVLHGICEYVERHAQRMAELQMTNPGDIGNHGFKFVRLEACGEILSKLAKRIVGNNVVMRVLDITSEIAIPTFQCVLVRDLQRAEGFGTHPNAIIAVEMAMLEAYQSISSYVAGGREDLSVKARSLGRHERPRPISMEDGWFWLNPDAVYHEPDYRKSFVSVNIKSEIDWCLERLRDGGCGQVLAVDLTRPEIAPAHVVRIFIPGLETNSPFYLGPRGRALLLSDMLPTELVLQAKKSLSETAHSACTDH